MRNSSLQAMASLLATLVLGWSVCAGAGRAEAATLPFVGNLSIQIAPFGTVGSAVAGTALVNGSGAPGHLTGLSIGANSLVLSNEPALVVTDPSAFPVVGLMISGTNQAGSFSGSGGAGFGGSMPFAGLMKVCLGGLCTAPYANLMVPLPVGAPATALVEGAVNLTVVGAPWTTGTAVVGTATQMGGVAPLSNTGAASGSVTLVTPIFISTNIGASSILPSFGVLTLHFVPEPATLGLLAAGMVGLTLWGRRQRRS